MTDPRVTELDYARIRSLVKRAEPNRCDAWAQDYARHVPALLDRIEVLEGALQLVYEGQWEHRCSDGVGGCTAVPTSVLVRVEAALGVGIEEIVDAHETTVSDLVRGDLA